MQKIVVLGLGSNKSFKGSSPKKLLDDACNMLEDFMEEIEFSSIYKTVAMYVTEQPDFFNMVATGLYDGTPFSLLDRIHLIEAHLGRDRLKETRNGPRTMDIDIELFGSLKVKSENLIIPHPRLLERRFVLEPLVEILRKHADVYKGEIAFYSEKLSLLAGQKVELLA